ncbi:DsrE family protein [Fulvivirga sedimenti]|uniref:DsrE family protein n=1 Tax=Fulvivirga sedimenti TaxID=2879465 RepID=A0A9X1HJV0_9BACT|nr:DsrE family protein [Fulvivirga sedimenti]MCA6073453.1 DsrE family protein [Fulvivirga sedimenti]
MKKILIPLFTVLALIVVFPLSAQDREYPVIKDFGGIYDIKDADVKPDPELMYNIVIDLGSTSNEKKYADYYLERVARMMNLHVIGGVNPSNLNVVVVLHANAVNTLLNHQSYNQKFGSNNPNIELLERLHEAGAEIVVCGQSLIGRNIRESEIYPEVKIATSMLTAVTTLQLKGYALLQF